jgi:hypothetical protein
VALLPWALRYYVFQHYRGKDFVVPRDDPSLAAFHRWRDAAVALPQVARTIPDHDRYLEHIGKYADASARSKVRRAPAGSRGSALGLQHARCAVVGCGIRALTLAGCRSRTRCAAGLPRTSSTTRKIPTNHSAVQKRYCVAASLA